MGHSLCLPTSHNKKMQCCGKKPITVTKTPAQQNILMQVSVNHNITLPLNDIIMIIIIIMLLYLIQVSPQAKA